MSESKDAEDDNMADEDFSELSEPEDVSSDEADDNDGGGEDDDDGQEDKNVNNFPIQTSLMIFLEKVVKPNGLDWQNEETVKGIWEEHPNLSKPSDSDDKNILHLLIESHMIAEPKTRSYIRQAISKITAKYPQLVQLRDTGGQTPLYMAMAKGDPPLIRAITKNCKARSGEDAPDALGTGKTAKSSTAETSDPLSEAIAVKNLAGGLTENVLHYVLRPKPVKTPPETIKSIVGKAFVNAITLQDQHGFTPLHYAVAYENSSETQFNYIKKLVKRGETKRLIRLGTAVLDLETSKDSLSVYRYHVKTREQFKEKPITLLPIRPKPSAKPLDGDGKSLAKETGPVSGPTPALDEKEKKWLEENKRAEKNDKAKDKAKDKAPLHEKEGERPTQPETRLLSPVIVKEGPSALADREEQRAVRSSQKPHGHSSKDVDSEDVGLLLSKKKRVPTGTMSVEELVAIAEAQKRERDEWADRIATELRKQYLRSRSHRKAINLLYDTQICFEYQYQNREIDAEAFIDSFANVKFESVLQYVAFSDIRVKNNPYKSSDGDDGRGRSDLLFFFKWLQEYKGVKCILKVFVQDNQDLPHSDEAIEEALKPFNVEYLNWSKPDLDPEVLINVGSELTGLVLHWNGNNAVLRSWSESEGLCRLKNLTSVDIICVIKNALESKTRTAENMTRFEKRLEQSRQPPLQRRITVHSHDDDDGFSSSRNEGTAGTVSGTQRASKASHRWLVTTDAFAQSISNIWDKIIREKNNEPQPATAKSKKKMPEIIVAVIDDGVDKTEEELSGRILAGRTFGYDGDRVRPWHASESGHGTIMATMICRVCPMVKIYPIRLKTSKAKGSGARRTIDCESAIEAINAAIDRGVDIISMSWTVAVPQGKLRADFDRAIQRAMDKPVLMFCSAKDSGHADEPFYPAGYRAEAVIRVGAASPTGLPYEWAGNLEKLDFIFPGVEVVQRHSRPPQGVNELDDENTGSSIATALGAGLAGLIMYCTHVGQIYGFSNLTEDHIQSLHKCENMCQAIKAFGCSTSKETGGKFVEVWNKLDGISRDLAAKSEREKRMKIAGLARDLVSAIKIGTA